MDTEEIKVNSQQDPNELEQQQLIKKKQSDKQLAKPQGDDQYNAPPLQNEQQQQPQQQNQQMVQGQVQPQQQQQMNPQQQAQWLIQQVQMLNQQKAMAVQQGQQPNPQIDQQIYQYQIQYQQIMAQQNPQQQQMQQQQQYQQQQQQQARQNQVGPGGGGFNQSFNTSKYQGLNEKQKRQKKREEMAQKSKYPRPLIPEDNEQNMDLGGAYQKCLFRLGECCGSLRAVCPCICVEYPFQQVDQGYQGIYQRFGKFVKTVGAGLHQINPCTDKLIKYSTKQITFDMVQQFCITKDNILVKVDGQLFYRVVEPRYAHYYCNDIQRCVIQLAYTTVRTIVGHFVLQDLFEKKDELTQAIQTFLSDHSWEWGVSIESVMIKEITPSQDVKDTLNVAAKERRLAESKIISAKTDVQSAKLMREAADILDSDAAMQIRYLETVKKLSATSKVILLGDEDEH